MIQCNCCMHQNKEGSAVCELCKFPLLANAGFDMDEAAAQFRRQRLDGCSVAVKLYYYTPDSSGNLSEQKTEFVRVADALSLNYHEIKWLSEEFNPPDITRDIELTVRVDRPSSSVEKTVTAHVTNTLRCSRLGLYADEGLTLRMAVGDQDAYVLSDALSLV